MAELSCDFVKTADFSLSWNTKLPVEKSKNDILTSKFFLVYVYVYELTKEIIIYNFYSVYVYVYGLTEEIIYI